jgi:hypothetical protein
MTSASFRPVGKERSTSMSHSGAQPTKQQREAQRRLELQQRRLEQERKLVRRRRNQRLKRSGLWGGGVLAVGLLIFFVARAILSSSPAFITLHLASGQPAHGQQIDGLACGQETVAFHIHLYLAIYANGQQGEVPPGLGIVAPSGAGTSALASNGTITCLYPLHVHDGEPNIIHVEGAQQQTFMLGQVFDEWGQPLSQTQVLGYTSDASHPLVFETLVNGTLAPSIGDPRALPLTTHATIAILYNSPQAHPTPYTDWNGL